MLNILFATEDFYPENIGGQGIFGYRLVSELAKKDQFVTVLAESRGKRGKFWQKEKNIRLLLTPFCFGNQLILALLEYFYFIFRLRNRYFDIVHANQLSGLFFVLFKPNSVGKVIVSVHNTNRDLFLETKDRLKRLLYRPLMFLERVMYGKADAVLFHTQSEKQVVGEYYSLNEEKLSIVSMGVSPVRVTKEQRLKAQREVRKQLKLGNNEKIILCVARLVKRKNVHVFLKALGTLQNEGAYVHGVVIGDGAEKQYLQNISPPNVSFFGFLDYLTIQKFYLAADLFVLLSVAEGGVSLAAMEAASYGLPLILSADLQQGTPILTEGKNGFTVDPENPHDLAEKILSAIPKARQMGRESQKRMRAFSWEKCAKETIKFYQSLLGKPEHML